jgi:N-acetylmuramoyl-L-alanine amidase
MDFFDKLTDVELLARLIYGEARGEEYKGMVAVAQVARNRSLRPSWWGHTLRECILKPYQFSCFLPGYSAPLVTPTGDVWLTCLNIAVNVIRDCVDDTSRGATHYFADTIEPPDWAASMTQTAVIGRHRFFK